MVTIGRELVPDHNPDWAGFPVAVKVTETEFEVAVLFAKSQADAVSV